MMHAVSCEACDQFVQGVGVKDIRDRWNRGERGVIECNSFNPLDTANE